MRNLFILLAVVALFSCKKSEVASGSSQVDSVGAAYFIKWRSPYATGEALLATSAFQYSSNRPVKRSGSYLPAPQGAYSNEYTDKVYDLVTYAGPSTIVIESKNLLNPSYSPPRWEISLQHDKPTRRISYVATMGSYLAGDTVLYFYNANDQIQRIEHHNSIYGVSYQFTRTFYFDEKDNLALVSGVYLRKPNTVLYTTSEEFSLYDDKPNPLKALWLWDDLYYRAVSRNNFSRYLYTRRDEQNNLTDSVVRVNPIRYDSNGHAQY